MNLIQRLVAALLLKWILFAMTWQVVTISYFYINQTAIEAEYCVNKDKPQLNCHGKCHLKKLLKVDETTKVERDQVPATNHFIVLFQAFSEAETFSGRLAKEKESHDYHYVFTVKTAVHSVNHGPPELIV